jgi:hypothetical protein
MASYSLSLSRGQTEFSIVEGTAAPGAGDIELRINLVPFANASGGPANSEIQQKLSEFANWISGKSNKIF